MTWSTRATVLFCALSAGLQAPVQAQPSAGSSCAPAKHHSMPLQRIGKADGFECHDPDGPDASFDCKKASSAVEKAICSSDQLRKKDCLMKYAYHDALNTAADSCAQEIIRTSQRDWIASREGCSADTAIIECVGRSYAARASELIAQFKLRSDVYSSTDFALQSPPVTASPSPAPQKAAVSVVSPSVSIEGVGLATGSKDVDWEDVIRKRWDLFLAIYVAVLGAISWRDQRGFDSRWKTIASKTALFLWAWPLMLIWLVLKGLWRFRREILGGMLGGGGSQGRSPAPSAQSTSLQIDETVNIEIQDVGGGAWKKMMTAPNNPDSIAIAFRNLKQNPSVKKVRAVGSRTGQLYDMQ